MINIYASELKKIDLEVLMERVNGNIALVDMLLKNFIDKYSEVARLMELDMKNNDFEELKLLVDSIKGVSRNLSLEELKLSASDLERTIKKGKLEVIEINFTKFKECLTETIEEIKDYLEK